MRGATETCANGASEHLVGREWELTEFERCLDDPDGPGLVLVRGERGAGRSAFAHAAAERLAARDHVVLPLVCVRGDQDRPLLLALRAVTAVREHRQATGRQPAAGRADLGAEVLPATERRDRAALADALLSALPHAAPVAVVVDDAQYADAASLDVLAAVAARRPTDVLVVTSVRHTTRDGEAGPAEQDVIARPLAGGGGGSKTITLARLTAHQFAAMAARWFQAVPDPALVECALGLTRGVPAATRALLVQWSRQDAIRIADGHVFLAAGAPVPVLPDDDRFLRALHELGEPCRTVAAALSVLWPLGRTAVALAAESTGLSAEETADGVRRLVAAGLLDELPGGDGGPRGWTFRIPLVEHAVRERLGPLERARISAAAVRALWAARDGATEQPSAIVQEADAETYLPDRIADAGVLVDRDRAAAELTAAAEALHPDPEDRGMLRWFRAALRLVEEPPARELALQRCAKAAWFVGDHRTARRTAETILRDPSDVLTGETLQEIASLLVVATAAGKDWTGLGRLGSARWWERLRLPPVAAVPAQALALCLLDRWQEVLDLLAPTEELWNTDPHSRIVPEMGQAVGAMVVQGRPDLLARLIEQPPAPDLPAVSQYSMTVGYVGQLLGAADLSGVMALLQARTMAPEALPPGNRFLLLHLQGRWDDALVLGRWMVAKDQTFAPAPQHHLFVARGAGILAARGKTASAARLIAAERGAGDGPLEVFLDLADAAVLRTMGHPDSAEQTLQRGLREADARGSVYGTDELAASLAVIRAEAGRPSEAADCLRRLGDLAGRTGSGRTRLLHLVASARVLGQGSGAAREMLHEAVDLARSRGQPFETAVTLAAAARDAGLPELLHEAYELYGETGSLLCRFHTRAAMREAGVTVPGRKQATAENEQLLATLITEGLTNRQIATVLRLSEDAVANRLSRLFARTGLRSRTEVVSAMLTGNPLTAADH
ncbi:helix-turn-helix transcriptional regulator [Streptomyces piniterrae]|uniref:Helix-turn-helix transcriptional regulator n=1 Tax=Streptomyces piniterrae TaxID=2571125 RepID=A0A4U0NYR4_9ACTN|nr:helix-turn-helix transcriptional regulator [Streptomyces piniterrae]